MGNSRTNAKRHLAIDSPCRIKCGVGLNDEVRLENSSLTRDAENSASAIWSQSNEQATKSLHSVHTRRINRHIRLKTFTVEGLARCVLGCAETKNAGTATVTGRVCSCTPTELRLQQSGTDVWWIIPRTPSSPPCQSTGSTVTVPLPPDAQRKEGPWPCQTTASKPSS